MANDQSFSTGQYSKETTKLIRAVQDNNLFQARKAIARGGNPRVRGPKKDTLLHICLSPGMAAVLLNHGALINARNDNMQTPLHTAMRRGISNLSSFLVDKGADLNAQEVNGTAPLHLAQNPNLNRLLLEKAANPNIQNSAGDTPLNVAVLFKGNPIVHSLLMNGADKHITNAAGQDALDKFQIRTQRTLRELEKMRLQLSVGEAEPSTSNLKLK